MRFLFILFVAVVGLAMVIPIAIALWMAFVSALGFAAPWLFFGFLFWALMSLSHRPRRRWQQNQNRWQSSRWQPRVSPVPAVAPPPADRRPLTRSWVESEQPARPELPIDVQVKVGQIKAKAEALQGYASRFPPFSKDLFLVRQTTTDYLPRTVNTYLALPPVDRERILVPGGRTALEELKGQLDLLDTKLTDIAEDLQRQDLDKLMANRHFLEQRFGQPSD
jgi:hypothetical protein